MRITQDTEAPPGGWKFTVPQTGITVTALYAKLLRRKVEAHLRANGHDPMPVHEFEASLCSQNGHGSPWCGQEAKPVDPDAPMITKVSVKRFLRTVIGLVKDRSLVPREEHARRMEICKTCPNYSLEGFGCTGCIDALRPVERILGKLDEGATGVCKICSCVCQYKAYVPNSTLDKAEEKDGLTYPENCWRLGH